ncbi:hypothetical protein F1737_09045 [Methanoplanus sp. FWC-SCC4]|uniref:Uncharacterized protein n=1 Tax=Methanochimaera problematica TaxID=2609417 RepID=A0AA97FC93_9EURY|nr:hypothetical protein [Methanoplanus sp. FWC-SCC4]WOF16825.1 hypothetical protein F1737_09045 [Methanoplanus sp. FWC-SCC4]
MKSTKQITLSYLLAFVNLLMIKYSDSPIHSKVNMLSVNLKLIRAVLREDMKKEQILKNNLDELSKRIETLRKEYSTSYELSYIYAAYNEQQRAEFEIRIYDILEDLYFYIEEYSLINEKTYGEVEAKSWTLPV